MSKLKITFQLNKLVRGSYYEDMAAEAHEVESRILEGEEKRRALIAKVREELDELESGDDDDPIDVGSAVRALAESYGFSLEEFIAEVLAKDTRVGGFEGGYFVSALTFDEDNRWVEYYRKDPEKYPESGNAELDKSNE